MRSNAPVLSVCLVFYALSTHAQQPMPSVGLGITKVTMGAPEDKTIAQLKQTYQNVNLESEPSAPIRQWIIASGKERYSSPSVSIYAKNNRIVGAEFSQEIVSTDEAFDALFALASKLSDEGRKTCQISTWTGYSPIPQGPSLSKATVALECGAYQVTLLRNQFKDSNGQLVSGYTLFESFGTITIPPPVSPAPSRARTLGSGAVMR
jgi:hypothetical protein